MAWLKALLVTELQLYKITSTHVCTPENTYGMPAYIIYVSVKIGRQTIFSLVRNIYHWTKYAFLQCMSRY
jgi:hypothetical protein